MISKGCKTEPRGPTLIGSQVHVTGALACAAWGSLPRGRSIGTAWAQQDSRQLPKGAHVHHLNGLMGQAVKQQDNVSCRQTDGSVPALSGPHQGPGPHFVSLHVLWPMGAYPRGSKPSPENRGSHPKASATVAGTITTSADVMWAPRTLHDGLGSFAPSPQASTYLPWWRSHRHPGHQAC